MSSAIRRAGVPCSLLIGSALLVACHNESPPSAKSDPADRQLSDQTAEREQMTRDGDAMIARGKKMYEQGVAAHDDGMIQDGRLMMTKGQQMKDKAAMLRQMKVGRTSPQ